MKISRSTIIGLVVAAVIIAAIVWGSYQFNQSGTPPPSPSNSQPISYGEIIYDTHTTPTYDNKELGFSLKLPASWQTYTTRPDTIALPDKTLIWFALPLQKRTIVTGSNYDVWYIEITPLAKWKASRCAGSQELCYQGPELGRNANFVFESGLASTTAVKDCEDPAFKADEPYFCAAIQDLPLLTKDAWQPR